MICIDTKDGVPQHALGKEAAHVVSDQPGEAGTQELLAFGREIGLRPQWLQYRGRPKEHFDVWGRKLDAALDAGAKEVGMRDMVDIIQDKRKQRDDA